jgi:molecular chaperone DnaK
MPVSVAPAAHAPVLVDVTPRALVVETAGGYSDVIVPRNAKIPCERTRAFSPARDHQRLVRIRVAQGEDPVFTGNTYLGELELTELRDGVRSEISIAVTFSVDASGTVQVSATDVATGRAARASLQLIGVAEETSIQRMRARTEQVRVS